MQKDASNFSASAFHSAEQGNLYPPVQFDMSLCASNPFNNVFCPLEAWRTRLQPLVFEHVNEPAAHDQDAELLRRIAQQDRLAFAEFYDRHASLMFSVAAKILSDPQEAEDVLQETCLQLWAKAGNFDPQLGKASSWVATMVRNKAIDRLRAARRRHQLAEQAGSEQAIASEVRDTANEAILGHDKAKLIQSAIGKLSADQRRAIELAYFSGLTQDEIAQKLSTPLGTVKARIRRGLLKLRDRLENAT